MRRHTLRATGLACAFLATWLGLFLLSSQAADPPAIIELPPIGTPGQLARLGWLEPGADYADACAGYCEFHGVTHGAMADHLADRSCNVPDRAGTLEANWPQQCRQGLGIYIDWTGYRSPEVMGLTQPEALACYIDAMEFWNAALDLRLYLEADLTTAKTYVSWRPLSGSTLAWSHLADNTCRDNKTQRYDIRKWSKRLLRQTAAHELGHLIGLGHTPGNFLMSPTIKTNISALTPTDIRNARRLGYDAPTRPRPGPPPGRGFVGFVELTDGTKIDAARILRVDLRLATGKPPGGIVLPPFLFH